MKLSLFGRSALALFAALILGLGMTGCGGGTIAFMWVLGQQYNQISGFKVDDYTGNLTQVPHEPFATNGTVPVSILVKPGGRYVYVLNQGTGAVAPTGTVDSNGNPNSGTHAVSSNISVFSVGGDGTLTYQISYATQGFNSKWMEFDSTGSTLYVLDQYSPNYNGATGNHPNGSVTAYTSDSSSGRLSLIQDTQACGNSTCPTYFEIGGTTPSTALPSPFMLKSSGSCLFAANRTAVAGYAFNAGQLINQTNLVTNIQGASHISSITGTGSFLVITDDGNNTVSLYSIGSGCSLTLTSGGVTSLAQYGTNNPEYALIDTSGKYLYVLNGLNTGSVTTPASTIDAFILTTGNNNQLQVISGSPYGTGSGPKCIVEDPTNQYLYVSNSDGSITGKVFQPTDGTLSNLTRGSSFSTGNNQGGCLVISGSID